MPSSNILPMSYIPIGESFNPEELEQFSYAHPFVRFGENNLFPQRLAALMHKSSTHQAVLQLKSELIAGEGFLANEASIPALLKGINLKGIAQDLALFSAFAIEIIWNKPKTEIVALHQIPFAQLRASTTLKNNKPEGFYYSPSWKLFEESNAPAFKPVYIPCFNLNEEERNGRELLVFADTHPLLRFYPLPDYFAALPSIQFEAEFQRFKLSSMSQGMFPSLHIEVEAMPTEEERKAFYEAVKKKFSGAKGAGEILVTYGFEGSGKTKVTPVQVNGNADLFVAWAKDASERIIAAHRLTSPALIGLEGKRGLGSNTGNEIATAFEHFYNSIIKSRQLDISKTLLSIAPFLKGFSGTLPSLEIANNKPLRYVFNEQVLLQLLTKEELREAIGYPASPNVSPKLTPNSSEIL